MPPAGSTALVRVARDWRHRVSVLSLL